MIQEISYYKRHYKTQLNLSNKNSKIFKSFQYIEIIRIFKYILKTKKYVKNLLTLKKLGYIIK